MRLLQQAQAARVLQDVHEQSAVRRLVHPAVGDLPQGGGVRVREMKHALLLAAACGCSSPAPAPGPRPQPIENVASAPLPPPASTCIAPGAHPDEARLVDGGLVVCYLVPQPSGYAADADCWRFDLATSAWTFATRKPRADVAPPQPNVTATATSARACTPDGSDCKTIPLSA